MIKLKFDLLIISALAAILATTWLVISILTNYHQTKISLEEITPLLKIPTYKINHNFWNQLAKYQPINLQDVYNPHLQPETSTRLSLHSSPATSSSSLNTPSASPSASISSLSPSSPSASNSAQTNTSIEEKVKNQ